MIWFEVLSGLGHPDLAPSVLAELESWWIASSSAWVGKEAKKVRFLMILAFRSIWLERNNWVFNNKLKTEERPFDEIKAKAERWKTLRFLRECIFPCCG